MALEMGVASPATRKRLLSGPLVDHIEGFYRWLKEEQFSERTIRMYLMNVSFLQEHLKCRYPDGMVRVTSEDIEGFLRIRSSDVRGAMRRLVDYLQEKGLYHCAVSSPLYEPLLNAYTQWLRDYRHAAERTIELRIEYTELLLDWLGPQATVEGLASLTFRQVQEFCLSFAQRRPGSTHSMGVTLRSFFRFCLHAGYLTQALDKVVPSVRHYRRDTVPRGYTEEEAQALLESIDRRHPAGCRDYAICLLFYTYGVRGVQLCALRLQDIYWEQNEVFFKGTKQGKDSLLPLTVEVGESLLDYVQNARPRGTGYAEVFLTTRAPYHPLKSRNLSPQIRKRAHAAGIDKPNRGPHAFRHAFATRMLQRGHSLKEVADVLGHRNLETTFIYTKVDFAALSQVALPWPREDQR